MRLFVRAERTGDWLLHVYCVREILPFFHAAGRYNYVKAAHLYLQQMEGLHLRMPVDEFQKFTCGGFFTTQRSNDYWSGTYGQT